MFRKYRNVMGILLASGLLLLGVVQVFAAPAMPGSGPDSALAPAKDWTSIAVGQRVWYAFKYAGDNSQITVDVAVSPSNSVAFAIWTPQNLADWANGENPIGRGSVNPRFNNDLIWSGNFLTPGTYYVVVDQSGPAVGNYLLTIRGTGVAVTEPAAAPTVTAAAPAKAPAAAATNAVTTTVKATAVPAAAATVTATVKATAPVTPVATSAPAVVTTTVTAPSGIGPDTAKTVTGEWLPIALTQRTWYAFHYAGDGSQIDVELQASPAGVANFSVWTPDDLLSWQSGNAENPVGRGSLVSTKFDITTSRWSGHTDKSGTYYVVVDQTGTSSIPGIHDLLASGANVGGYSLTISGGGVSAAK